MNVSACQEVADSAERVGQDRQHTATVLRAPSRVQNHDNEGRRAIRGSRIALRQIRTILDRKQQEHFSVVFPQKNSDPASYIQRPGIYVVDWGNGRNQAALWSAGV